MEGQKRNFIREVYMMKFSFVWDLEEHCRKNWEKNQREEEKEVNVCDCKKIQRYLVPDFTHTLSSASL